MPALSTSTLLALAAVGLIWFAGLEWPKVWLFGRLNLR